jgi:hypothetical protein
MSSCFNLNLQAGQIGAQAMVELELEGVEKKRWDGSEASSQDGVRNGAPSLQRKATCAVPTNMTARQTCAYFLVEWARFTYQSCRQYASITLKCFPQFQ